MSLDRFCAETEVIDRNSAVCLFSLKDCKHLVGGLIFRIGFQYLFNQRNCALVWRLIEDLDFAFQSCNVTGRKTQCLVKGSERILIAASNGKYDPLQCPESEVRRRLVQGGSCKPQRLIVLMRTNQRFYRRDRSLRLLRMGNERR